MQILSVKFTETGDKIYHLQIPPSQMIFVGYILESLEGWVFYTTIDAEKSILWVEVIKDYVQEFDDLLPRIINAYLT